jgi:cytochrome P450
MEGTEILRAALAAYDVHAPDPKPEPAQAKNVTLVPRRGSVVRATPR